MTNTETTSRTFQPEQHAEMMDFISEHSPNAETVTNADGSVIVTVPARMVVDMAGIGETWTLPMVPPSLQPMVRDLAESGILRYGPTYSRQAAEAVRDAARFLGWGDVEATELYIRKAHARTL